MYTTFTFWGSNWTRLFGGIIKMYLTCRFIPEEKACKECKSALHYPNATCVLIHWLISQTQVCPIFFLLPFYTTWRVYIYKFYFHSQRCNATHPFTEGVYIYINIPTHLLERAWVLFFYPFQLSIDSTPVCLYNASACSLNTFCARCKLQWLRKDLSRTPLFK